MIDIKLECNFHLTTYHMLGIYHNLVILKRSCIMFKKKRAHSQLYHLLKQEKAEVFKARLNVSNKIKIAIDSHGQRFVLSLHTQHT